MPTGLCVSLVYNTFRSLVTNLGAAGVYTLDDFKKANLQLDSIKIIYIEGYFVRHSLDVAKELVKRAQEKNIIVAFNLNSLNIFQVCESYKILLTLNNIINISYEACIKLIPINLIIDLCKLK